MSGSSGELKLKNGILTAIFVIVFAFVGMASGGYFLLNKTADRIIAEQAERNSLAWADYIASGLNRAEMIAAGAELSADEQEISETFSGSSCSAQTVSSGWSPTIFPIRQVLLLRSTPNTVKKRPVCSRTDSPIRN